MKRGLFLAGSAGFFLLITGCAVQPRGALVQVPAPLPPAEPEIYQILDFQGKDQGGVLPPWVNRYLTAGFRGVEGLPEYEGKYVFIGENTGINNRLLRQWADRFSPDHDFARLAAARIEARFSQGALAYPDDEYGAFFALMVKAVADGIYEWAERADDFWVFRQYFDPGGDAPGRAVYDYFVLVTIDKSLLETQVRAILEGIKPEPPPSR